VKPPAPTGIWRFESQWRTPIRTLGFARDPSIVLRAERALTVMAVVEAREDSRADSHGPAGGGADLWTWTSQDGGDSFGPGSRVNPEGTVVAGRGETAPCLIVGPKGLCVAYEERLPDGSGTRLMSSWSAMGDRWASPQPIAAKSIPSSNGYVAMDAGPDATVAAAWLDGRRKDPRGPDVMVAVSRDNGRSWNEAVMVVPGACPCCRPGIAVAPGGEIAVTFRNVEPGNIRDIFLVHSTDRGRTFSRPRLVARDGWKLDGCPHSGAPIAHHAGRWHIAWYSGGRGPSEAGLRLAAATPDCSRFSVPKRIGGSSLDPNHPMLAKSERALLAMFQARPARGDGWEAYAPHAFGVTDAGVPDSAPSECPAAGIGANYPRAALDNTGRLWVVEGREGRIGLRRGRRNA